MSTNTKLAEALREIADAHIPDMPSAWNDPSSWAERQHARLRRIAREALRQYEQAKPAEPVASLMTNIQSGDVEVVWNDDGFDRELWHETPLYADPVEQAAKAVPAGFKLIPVEPTPEMLTAAGREDDKAFIDGMPHGATAADTWAAMLAAAPTPPAPEAQQTAGQEQDERAAFEAWAATYSTFPLERDDYPRLGTTSYTAMEQAMLWDAWRAALAQHREPLTDEQIAEGRYLTWAAEPDDAPEAWSFMRGARWADKHFGIGATTGKEPGNV